MGILSDISVFRSCKKRLAAGKVLTVRVMTGSDLEKIKEQPHADFVVLAR
jgi:hypothetical protein